ncbi:MAG: phosphoserine phosphatase SerB [Neomegalonema sp.]|nr:phosphoserine phosphatase SerB [Neomegalonema sp.]
MTHVIVLTSASEFSEADLLGALPGGVELRWLGARSVEFDGSPEQAQALRPSLARMRIDVNAVPVAGREKALLIADMDSTIIECECIDEIADFAGVKPQVAAITEAAMRGEVDFEGALKARVGLLKGLPETQLQQVFDERVVLSKGARTLVQTMNALGARTALVSGGFTFFSGRVAEATGFQSHQANRLLATSGTLNGEVAEPILGREAKLEALRAICAERGIGLDAALAVGDGANDLAMIGAAGLGVAYRAKPVVAAEADAQINFSDLTALLALQGIREDDYAAV